ncbi:hypothetical protein AN191_11645 [Loktanella sp. 5RATIMAR09]|uniref:hypothetical protein n=1 Tax=Loktanella sp. 5RATIMAR09 TaxID=1225655 RepID=UPI0006EB8827|nr:hypothetical protein [Loktanella sp. 5RATIMAR09]KQI71635.1 hypothetical protein AN191_11645 [Loktanella sp. 5RATIMAR09]
MAQKPNTDRAGSDAGLGQGEPLAIAASVAWVIAATFLFWLTWPDPAPADGFATAWFVLVALAIILPAALIWVAVASARAVRNLRHELFQAQTSIDRLADMLASKTAAKVPAAARPAVPKSPPPPETAAAPQVPQDPPASQFASRREVSRLIVPRAAPQMPADQPALALDTPSEVARQPIARPDLVKALHFPNDENDTDGFGALRRALRDRDARKLVQASQDVLTLLSQDGIYMDDLRPAPVSADIWRRFAKGERGRSVEQLGGIRDQTHLSQLSRRTREDAIFRDAVHHFLRCYDQFLVTFAEDATDTDLLALAETRTSRAFMLLARTTGTFD